MASLSPADPSPLQTLDTGNPSIKHPYAQIVRCRDATTPSTKKAPQLVNPEQIPTLGKAPDTNQVRVPRQVDADLSIAPSESTLDDKGIAADARVFDEASVKGEEGSEASKTVGEGPESGAANAVAADGTEAAQNKPPECGTGDNGEPRVSRPPWRKPSIITEGEIKPQPVMGATAWPALAEARNMKSSETRKLKGRTPQPAPEASTQESLPKPGHSGDSSTHQQGIKHKPTFKGGAVGIGRPSVQPIESGASSLEHPASVAHRAPEQSMKHNTHARMKGSFSGNQHMDNDRVSHQRNDGGAPFPNNNRKWRNNHRDQGRGNYGWQHHSRAYESAGDMFTLLHEQRIGPRNMPRPQPFMNMNPAFYSLPHFQNGGMYYIPPGAPEFVHGPFFPPMGPAGGVMHGPDPVALRSLLLKQIDYYFSVENLCRDVFLRTQMDEEGFVPVSVIATFNRVQNLSANPILILESLQHSAVVEVQHDRIRRRNDRGKWRIIQGQGNAFNHVQGNASVGNMSEGVPCKPEQASESGSVSSSVEVNNGSAKAADVPLADVERARPRSDRINGNGDCIELGDRSRQQGSNGINLANSEHYSLSGTDASTQSFLYRDASTKEKAVNNTVVGDSAGCQRPISNFVQDGTESADIDAVAHGQKNCSSNYRLYEESGMVSQTTADGKRGYWKAPEGFWMQNDAYCVQSCFEQDTTQLTESDFMLEAHEGGDEHHGEANERDIQRLINVPHTPLGSFIAVP